MSGKRPRAARRARERETRKLVRQLDRLAEDAPGGSPDRPIDMSSSAVIEPRAQRTPCPLCQGPLRVEDHQAARELRVVAVRCGRCGVARKLWFRLVPASS